MADDHSEYVVQERGHFWWGEVIPPEQYPYLPGSPVAGELRITVEGRITVHLDRPLEPPFTPPDSHETYAALRARRIRGLLRNSGQGVLLLDLAQSGGGFLAAQCLVGDQPFSGPIGQPAFSDIYANLNGFQEWFWSNALDFKRGKIVSVAKHRQPKPITYRLENGRLEMREGINWTAEGHFDLTWKSWASLSFKPNQAMGLEATIEWHRWLQDFMILLTDSDYRLEWPDVRWGEHRCTLYFQWFAPKGQRPRRQDIPIIFPQIKDDFGTLFEKWLKVRDRYRAGVYLYLSTRRGMQIYAESHFISLVTGLEAFLRIKYTDDPLPDATAKVDRIVSQIAPKEDMTWAKARLTRAIQPTLEDQIFKGLNALSLGFDKRRLKRFAKECAQLRNDLAHYGGPRDRATPYSDFLSSVMKKNNALRPLCHALALTEIGLDPEMVRSWAMTKPQAYLRKFYFAEADLIEPDNPTSG